MTRAKKVSKPKEAFIAPVGAPVEPPLSAYARQAVKEVLTGALELVKRGWTKGSNARNRSGTPCGVFSRAACRVCPNGAIELAGRSRTVNTRVMAKDVMHRATRRSTGKVGFISFNDDPKTRKKDVIALFEWAIGSLMGKGEMIHVQAGAPTARRRARPAVPGKNA